MKNKKNKKYKNPSRYVQNKHYESKKIREKELGVQTRRKFIGISRHANMEILCQVEPKNSNQSSEDKHGIKEIDEELYQIEKNKTWEIVPRPKRKNVIGTEWVFKNKLNEDGHVVRNNGRLVCEGYALLEGIDFEEIFSHVARL